MGRAMERRPDLSRRYLVISSKASNNGNLSSNGGNDPERTQASPYYGDVLLIGRQTVLLTVDSARALIARTCVFLQPACKSFRGGLMRRRSF